MPLRHLESVPQALGWLADRGVRALATDSRRVRPGDGFIAWPGYAQDGRRHVAPALAAGAAACLVEADGVDAFGFDDPRIAAVPGLKAATGPLASGFFGEPSRALDVVAVTGTNGKTSTAWWTAQALGACGRRAGVVGTLGVGEPPAVEHTGLTTPDPVTLQAAFRRFADAGFAACAIEASSIGLVEGRMDGTRIAVAAFTNFTQDHLDFHGSMAAYWQAKAALFAWTGLRAAVVNLDDPRGAELAAGIAARGLALWTVSAGGDAVLSARAIGYVDGGIAFEVHEAASKAPVRSALIGAFNVSNLLVVIGALRALGVPLAEAAAACATLGPVPGRMQRVDLADAPDGAAAAAAHPAAVATATSATSAATAAALPQVVVDYAHTPDALEKALAALQPLARARGGALCCVFGCGGNRDAGKRPLMGAIAQRLAQQVIVTSDNPRHEAPAEILRQIVAGMSGTPRVIEDRRAAIAEAVASAAARDVILIAGKGHEDYQEIAGVKHPFDDAVEARAALARRRAAA